MDNNNPTDRSGQAGKFFSGFLLGFLVGAAVVFLLGTKKGKRLLKMISEEGIDNISDLLEEADKTKDLDEVVEKPPNARASEGQGEFATKETVTEEKPKARRFFRGISRRVN